MEFEPPMMFGWSSFGEPEMKLACLLVSSALLFPFQACADPKLDALIAAYPDRLASYTDSELVWKDGTRMPLGSARPNKPFAEMLERADIRDQFAISYPLATAPFQAPAGIRSWPLPFVSAMFITDESYEFFSMYG